MILLKIAVLILIIDFAIFSSRFYIMRIGRKLDIGEYKDIVVINVSIQKTISFGIVRVDKNKYSIYYASITSGK